MPPNSGRCRVRVSCVPWDGQLWVACGLLDPGPWMWIWAVTRLHWQVKPRVHHPRSLQMAESEPSLLRRQPLQTSLSIQTLLPGHSTPLGMLPGPSSHLNCGSTCYLVSGSWVGLMGWFALSEGKKCPPLRCVIKTVTVFGFNWVGPCFFISQPCVSDTFCQSALRGPFQTGQNVLMCWRLSEASWGKPSFEGVRKTSF